MLRLFKVRKTDSRGGFTLIEVMVCVFVFTVVTLIFTGTIMASKKASSLSGQYAQATSLCQHKIDQLRAVGYGRLNYTELKNAGIIDPTKTSQPYRFPIEDEVGYYLSQPTTEITISQDPYNSQVMIVKAQITWINVARENRSSTMKLYARIANIE